MMAPGSVSGSSPVDAPLDAPVRHRYVRPRTLADAITLLADDPQAAAIAGGTDLVPLSQAGLRPLSCVVDLGGLALAQIIVDHPGQLRLGALVTMADAAGHALVLARAPLVAWAINAGASVQVRHRATLGGNLLQAPRCPWFRSGAPACNRRTPGSGCGAQAAGSREGERWLAIVGGNAACAAASTSDLAVALQALDARVETAGRQGTRLLPLAALWSDGVHDPRPPGTPILAQGELITALHLPLPAAGVVQHVAFEKVRERASFEFAVVSLAACLSTVQGTIHAARLSAGGVAPVPWRLAEVEAALVGQPLDAIDARAISLLAARGVQPFEGNAFKATLLCRLVQRVLDQARAAA